MKAHVRNNPDATYQIVFIHEELAIEICIPVYTYEQAKAVVDAYNREGEQ